MLLHRKYLKLLITWLLQLSGTFTQDVHPPGPTPRHWGPVLELLCMTPLKLMPLFQKSDLGKLALLVPYQSRVLY